MAARWIARGVDAVDNHTSTQMQSPIKALAAITIDGIWLLSQNLNETTLRNQSAPTMSCRTATNSST